MSLSWSLHNSSGETSRVPGSQKPGSSFVRRYSRRSSRFRARVSVVLGGPVGVKRESSKLKTLSESMSSGTGSVGEAFWEGSVELEEASARASCCWRRRSRVITASASAVFVTFRPLATKSSNSGTSHSSSADAGRVLDTPAVVMISFPPIFFSLLPAGRRLYRRARTGW